MEDRLCRRSAVLILFAGLAIGGCKTTQPMGSAKLDPKLMNPEAASPTSVARASSASLDPRRKNEPPKASTFCAVAAVKAEMAKNPELSFADAEQIRAASRQAYMQALAVDPKCEEAYIGLAKSFADIDDLPQCCAWYDKAIAVQPKNANLQFEKGMTQARFKDWDGALTSLQAAHNIDPDNRIYTRMAGLTMARAGRFDDAAALLSRCMKDEEMHYNLARMHQHLGHTELALGEAQLALKARPTYGPARDLIGELAQPAGDIRTIGHSEPARSAAPGRLRVDGID